MKTEDTRPTVLAAYHRLWREWLHHYRAGLLISLGLMAITAGATAAYAKLTQWMMQTFEAGDMELLRYAPFAVLGVTLAKGVSQYIQVTYANRVLSQVEADMQSAMYTRLVGADLARLQEEPPAALAARFSADVGLIRNAVGTSLRGISFILIIVATFVTMMTIDWVMTIGLFAIFAAALVPINLIGNRLRHISATTQREIGRMTAEINEGLSGIRLAKTYRLEDRLAESASRSFHRLRDLKVKALNWRAQIEPMIESLGGAAIAGLLLFVGWRLASGDGSFPDFVGLLTGLVVMANPAQRLGNVYAGIMSGVAALERVHALFDAPDYVVERPDAQAIPRI
ncbi:MAG: ABC transporter transmembrane domain-containing protein, partial [Pseudomonadota bacterium]